MARPLRIEVPNGWYHVTDRGNARQRIFLDDRDRRHWLELAVELQPKFALRVAAYVLMDNHYHLIVQTPECGLSQAMQWLNVSYSMYFNVRHNRSGHVFEGRFKSVLVEGEGSWLLELSVYVHLNPLRIKALGLDKQARGLERLGVSEPPTPEEVTRRLDRLRKHRWSSYPAYAGYAPVPDWLETDAILDRVTRRRTNARTAYRKLVEDRISQGVEERPWSKLKAQAVLGSEQFFRSLLARSGSREQTGAKMIERRLGFDEIVAAVEAVKGERWEAFRDRHGDWGRDLAWALARRHTALTLAELGRRSGGARYSAVAQGVRSMTRRAEHDRTVQAAWRAADEWLKSKISRPDPNRPATG